MAKTRLRARVLAVAAATFFISLQASTFANHSWNGFHWARTANPFTVKLGNNLSSQWQEPLATASTDWSQSTVLNTTIVPGGAKPRNCRPTAGQDEICNATYGNTGWLGVAQVWISGSHITQGTVKLNDTYFNSPQYNDPGWRHLVTCQEIGHTLGLDHQDETFDNPNLGTCMDYTSNPYGPPDNEHPNKHDYDELVAIYSHTDSTTTVGQTTAHGAQGIDPENNWGRVIRANGRTALFELDLGGGHKVFTFVIWA